MSGASLTEMRVLELGGGVSAALAARLLGDHGADVVKLEEPEGDRSRRRGPFPGGTRDPEQSGLFLGLNTNKRGVRVDLASREGRGELLHLIDWADVVIHSCDRMRATALGLDAESLERRRPDLVTLQITPFGASGPYADFRAEELTVSNAGGWAGLCPAATQRPDLPPLKVFGHQCGLMSGVAGATAAMAAYSAARRSGIGEFIDFSEQAYTASVLENGIPHYGYQGLVATRYGTRLLIPWGIFECRDGPLFLVCVEQDQWERLVQLMGSPEWASLEVFETLLGRAQNHDILHTFVQEWLADQSVLQVYHEMQRLRICAAPVLSCAQLSESEHLRAREFFCEVSHSGAGRLRHLGSAARTAEGRLPVRRGAPMHGEHDGEILAGKLAPRARAQPTGEARLPLEGVRVADLSWAWAGPFCAMNLAHLGAEVIRFESEGRSDLYRRLPIHPEGIPATLNTSGMFNQWNQGKKSVALNLGEPRAVELLKDFVATCDVVVENFATGVMERLGLGYEVLAERNPGIILASISGYGQTGPYRDYMGYGPAIPPLTGLSAATGFVGGGPSEVGVSMPDPTAGITAAFEICAALEKRERSGRGCHLDVSLWEATAVFSIEAWMDFAMNGKEPLRQGNRDPWMAPHGCFPTRGEDTWISIACASDEQWRALCAIVAPDLADDARFHRLEGRKRHEDALEAALAAATRAHDRWELTRSLQARGVAAFPSMTTADIATDPHLEARGFLERLPHPEVGARVHAGIPYRLRRRPNGVRAAAPRLGADTESVLGEVLGCSAADIQALRDAKVLC
jgi:crotonobetainyl-CoA:carnitine CoA-transferase CaiB-like acyl-CoA transferase